MFAWNISTCTSIWRSGCALTDCHIVCLSSSACRPGFYKAYAGNIKCSKCPPHSFSYGEASAICRCEKGFFRAEKDPPTMACTREYTRKKRVLSTIVTPCALTIRLTPSVFNFTGRWHKCLWVRNENIKCIPVNLLTEQW